MKKILAIVFTLILIKNIASAETVTFVIEAVKEIQNGKISKASGTSIQEYEISDKEVILKRTYQKFSGWENWNYTFKTYFFPTLLKHNYYLFVDDSGNQYSVRQFDENFEHVTIYQFNGLGNHCTVWYGSRCK